VSPNIVILTDFGTQDPFVGIMKGVIANILPGTSIIDLTHEIPPGDIQRASIVLWQSLSFFPKGTVFLAVVDPGVGTQRHPIILNSQGYVFVGPDNGIFTFVLEKDAEAWILENTDFRLQNPHTTFHGRDIFAPAAAYAAGGIQVSKFGRNLKNLIKLQQPKLISPSPGVLIGEALHADRFGNILTSLGVFHHIGHAIYELRSWLGEQWVIQIQLQNVHIHLPNRSKINWVKTFAEIPPGKCSFIVGSSGLLEIVSNKKSAASLLKLEPGNIVELHFPTR